MRWMGEALRAMHDGKDAVWNQPHSRIDAEPCEETSRKWGGHESRIEIDLRAPFSNCVGQIAEWVRQFGTCGSQVEDLSNWHRDTSK